MNLKKFREQMRVKQAEACKVCQCPCDRDVWAEGGCLEWEAKPPKEIVVVSRHKAAVEFVARYLGRAEVVWLDQPRQNVIADIILYDIGGEVDSIPVFGQVTTEDIQGKIVYGNLPLDLAAEADRVGAICFTGKPPRGAEYTLADMDAAGAMIKWFKVQPAQP